MRQQYGQIITRFEAETQFEVGAIAPVPFRGALETELEQLKERLLGPLLNASTDPAQGAPLRRAANEAAGLAWFTPFPLLVFPTLLEEKAASARRQHERQQDIRRRSRGMLDEAGS